MSNKNNYSLIIKDGDDIEFEGIVSFDQEHGKHLRVLQDEMGYEEMISSLMYKGYLSSKKVNERKISINDDINFIQDIYEDTIIEIDSIEVLKNLLQDKGFECEVVPSNEYSLIASISADGQDLGYEVISNSNKIKISNFAIELFRTANHAQNNPDYEPIENEKAGSYEIKLFNPKPGVEVQNEILSTIQDIKDLIINADRYWEKGFYYSLVHHILTLRTIKHLETIKVSIAQNEPILFGKKFLDALHEKIKLIISAKDFYFSSTDEYNSRAFDDKNLSFKLDTDDGVRFCTAENEVLYKKIEKNKGKNASFVGKYESGVKSVFVTKFTVLP